MFALVFDATYLSEKSCVSSAVHNPIDARSTKKKLAYDARTPLATRSSRRIQPPAKETVAHHAAMRSATQSDSSPMSITRESGGQAAQLLHTCGSARFVAGSLLVLLWCVLVARRALREQRRRPKGPIFAEASFDNNIDAVREGV